MKRLLDLRQELRWVHCCNTATAGNGNIHLFSLKLKKKCPWRKEVSNGRRKYNWRERNASVIDSKGYVYLHLLLSLKPNFLNIFLQPLLMSLIKTAISTKQPFQILGNSCLKISRDFSRNLEFFPTFLHFAAFGSHNTVQICNGKSGSFDVHVL